MEELGHYRKFIDDELTKVVYDKKVSNWLPFIGVNYKNTPEKILIVGLSHYDKEQSQNWTKNLKGEFPNIYSHIENSLLYENSWGINSRMYRGLECIFFNVAKKNYKLADFKKEREKLWNSISFSQLIEKPMNGESRHYDTKTSRKKGFLKIIELIKIIEPNHIILLSCQKKYHNELEKILGYENPKRIYIGVTNKSDIRTILLKVNEHIFQLHTITHPSYYRYICKQNKLLKTAMPKFFDYFLEK